MTQFVVLLRGFPYSTTDNQVVQFLNVNPAHIEAVELTKNQDGKASGEAYVILNDQSSAESCLSRHKETMEGSTRYIEVFKSSMEKYQSKAPSRGGRGDDNFDGCVRFRGLPFEATLNDMIGFLEGLTWPENGIFFPISNRGTSTGEAYVQFDTYTCANEALQRNRREIGGRYIEVFKSSNQELRKCMIETKKKNYGINTEPQGGAPQQGGGAKWGGLNLGGGSAGGPMGRGGGFGNRGGHQAQRQTPYGRQANGGGFGAAPAAFNGGGFGGAPKPVTQAPPVAQAPPNNSPYPHVIGLSGAPQGVKAPEIQAFFRPHKAIAVNIMSAGTADVAFKTHEMAVAAMEKNMGILQGAQTHLILKSQAPQQAQGWQSW